MGKHRFERTLGGEVILDLCFTCQGIWFDEFESVQITPGGIVKLFELIHAHRDETRQALREPLHCPRCDEKLLHGLDIVKPGGHFNYHRCLQKHGRFTVFAQFMIEKGFVRQLTASEIDTLAARVGTVRCNGCGAPVDIRKEAICSHCRAPIAILDPQAVEEALGRYRQAEIKRTTISVEALGDAIVMREQEKSRRERERRQDSLDTLDLGDLIEAGVDIVLGLIRH